MSERSETQPCKLNLKHGRFYINVLESLGFVSNCKLHFVHEGHFIEEIKPQRRLKNPDSKRNFNSVSWLVLAYS